MLSYVFDLFLIYESIILATATMLTARFGGQNHHGQNDSHTPGTIHVPGPGGGGSRIRGCLISGALRVAVTKIVSFIFCHSWGR